MRACRSAGFRERAGHGDERRHAASCRAAALSSYRRRCRATPATTPCARSPSAWDAPLPAIPHLGASRPGASSHGGGAALSHSRARRAGDQSVAHLRRHRARATGSRALDLLVVLEYRLTPTAQLADYVLPTPARWSARCCRCTAASPTSPTEGRRPWSPTTSAGATTTCSASWDAFGAGRVLARGDARGRVCVAAFTAGLSWEEFCSEGTYWPRPATRSMRRSERMGVRSDSPRRRAESSSQASFCLSTAAAACPSPCLPGLVRLLAAPSRSSPALADSRIMLPCTSRIRAFVRGGSTGGKVSPACAEALGLREGDAVEVVTDAGVARFVLAVRRHARRCGERRLRLVAPRMGAEGRLGGMESRMPTT